MIRFVYTPIHGVGLEFAKEAFKRFEFDPFEIVEEQVGFLWKQSQSFFSF
jgi:phosphomannomutase